MRPTVIASLLALPLALSSLAMADAVDVYDACTDTDGKIVVSDAVSFDETITTPIGALNQTPEEVGTFVLDLSGREVGSRGSLEFVLGWDTPEGLGDYDLITDGDNQLSTAQPEFKDVSFLGHCSEVTVEVAVFTGTPLDTVTLGVTAG